ncbi:Hsp20/alpha crystallin family protein [Streptomyces sp. NPDC091268]|uniref:Hsp20/alpha crystallin family protein n=1 Tax=Streptomyces sp. NPDC091268 TaxID=3365979 RepID=UPI0037F229D9
MLMRTDPFRELDRLTQQVLGTAARPTAMAMDAYREGDAFVVELDLPGVEPESIDLDVERNVLSITAERRTTASRSDGASGGDGASATDGAVLIVERPSGTFSRQLFLGEALDADRIEASYEAGVLRLRIPVAEEAKPRKIEVKAGDGSRKEINA